MKHFFFEVKQKIIYLVRFFYSFLNGGEKCIVCDKKCYVVPVCKNCKHEYFDIKTVMEYKRCKKCGKILISTEEICSECRESTVMLHTDKVLPLFSYLLWNKELLFKWKTNNVRSLSSFLAEKVAEALWMMEVEYIVPVPPRPGKIKKNGWDQIDELCMFLKFRYGFKSFDVLERVSEEQQKKLNRENRLAKIKSVYILKNEKQQEKVLKPFHGILPEKVCIIDDVCTTGATIERCAEILKEMGVKKVYAVTLFTV